MRRPKSCGWIDVAAGFPVSITPNVCAECHKRGVQTPEAQLYRQGIVKVALTHVTLKGSASPVVQEAMAGRGVVIPKRSLNSNHWPFPRWRSWVNSWEGTPYPKAVFYGVWEPTKKACRDLMTSWRGDKVRACDRCGCWVPAKKVVLFLMDMVHPLEERRR